MESITKQVQFTTGQFWGDKDSEYQCNGHKTTRYDLMTLDPPTQDYEVTYTLDEQGPLKVTDLGNLLWVYAPGVNAPVCWLPQEWLNKQVRREVKVTEPALT